MELLLYPEAWGQETEGRVQKNVHWIIANAQRLQNPPPLEIWWGGASGSMGKGRVVWFLLWPWCPAAGTVRGAGRRRRLKGVPGKAILHQGSDIHLARHLAPTTFSCYIHLGLIHLHLPRNLGQCSLWININYPGLLPQRVQGDIPWLSTLFPLLGEISTTGCVAGKHRLHQ